MQVIIKAGLYAPFFILYKIYTTLLLFLLQKLHGDLPSAHHHHKPGLDLLEHSDFQKESKRLLPFLHPSSPRPKLIFKGVLSKHLNQCSIQIHFETGTSKKQSWTAERVRSLPVPPQHHLQWQIRVEEHNKQKLLLKYLDASWGRAEYLHSTGLCIWTS